MIIPSSLTSLMRFLSVFFLALLACGDVAAQKKKLDARRIKPPTDQPHIVSAVPDELGGLYVTHDAEPQQGVRYTLVVKNPTQRKATFELKARAYNDLGEEEQIVPIALELRSKESETVTFEFTAKNFGWYGVRFELSTGHLLKNAFCILRPPAEGVRPDSIFGIAMRGESEFNLEIASKIGVKWRRGIPGSHLTLVSPEPGIYWDAKHKAALQAEAQAWIDAGVMMLGNLHGNLRWNVSRDEEGVPFKENWKAPPHDLEIHSDAVLEVVNTLYPLVKHYESWNEPGPGNFWKYGTAQEYRDMLESLHTKINENYEDVSLIAGSHFYKTTRSWMYPNKEGHHFDGVAPHVYHKPNLSTAATVALESAMLNHWHKEDKKVGIWITESSPLIYRYFSRHSGEERYLHQARSIAPNYLVQHLAAGDAPFKLFFFASGYGRPGVDVALKKGGSGDRCNLWNFEVPTAGIAAYSAMTHFVEDGELQGDLMSDSRRAWALHYSKKGGEQVVVLLPETTWPMKGDYTGADNHRSAWRFPALDFEVYDYMGRKAGVEENGFITIRPYTREAHYIVSKKSAQEVKAAFSQITFSNLDAVTVLPQTILGSLHEGTEARFLLRNETLRPLQVRASIQSRGANRLILAESEGQMLELAPGEEKIARFPVKVKKNSSNNRYTVDYQIEVQGGEPVYGKADLQVARSDYGSVKVDGDLDDWSESIFTSIKNKGELANWGDSKPSMLLREGYELATRWDRENLYIAAVIPDATPVQQVDNQVIDLEYIEKKRDRIEIGFNLLERNPENFLIDRDIYEKALAKDIDYGFRVEPVSAPGGMEPVITQTLAPGEGYYKKAKKIKGGQVSIDYDESKQEYTYEVAIPLALIPELQKALAGLHSSGDSVDIAMNYMVVDRHKWDAPTRFTEELGAFEFAAIGLAGTGGTPNFRGNTASRIRTHWRFER